MPKKLQFDWNPWKALCNWANHGISFPDTRNLWNDENRLILSAFRPEDGESREAIIAGYKGKVWRAVFVYRGRKIWLISSRPASRKEIRFYQAAKTDHGGGV